MKYIIILMTLFSTKVISFPEFTKEIGERVGFLFSHGLGGNENQVHWYSPNNTKNWHILKGFIGSFDYPEVGDMKKANLAQQADVDTLKNAHEQFEHTHNIDKTVLVGLSRGAACILNYAATKPNNLKAIVVEAPFDAIENVIKRHLNNAYMYWIPGLHTLSCKIYRGIYPAYKADGIKPIEQVHKIDKNLPILFVHSKKDLLIPIRSCEKMFHKLKQCGHKHVYFLRLDDGRHASYQFGPDAHKYQVTVHAFYKRYGIPHEPMLAAQGENYLNKSFQYFG